MSDEERRRGDRSTAAREVMNIPLDKTGLKREILTIS
jgi:hypothetical protein